MPLLAVPNFSEGRDRARVEALGAALSRDVALLDAHSDTDHNRSVFTLAGKPGPLRDALLSGAQQAIETLDMNGHDGVHPAIGVLDVCPIVWLNQSDRDAAHTEAIEVAEQIGGLGVPVFLYGEMAVRPDHVERAYFRNGGLAELWLRMQSGELRADHGPDLPHRTAGATLVTSRPPLAAFNVELNTDDVEIARSVAAGLRESGGGLPGVRAIGLPLSSGRAQVSTNIHNPLEVPLKEVVRQVRDLSAPLGARPVEAELIGLIAQDALIGYPDEVPIRGFDASRCVIERRLELSTD